MNKVETLDSTGWSTLTDFPKELVKKKNTYLKFFRISHHVLMGIPSGSLLLAGGYVHYRRRSAIWLLENGIWNPIGNLQNVNFKNEKNISLELRLMLMDLQ